MSNFAGSQVISPTPLNTARQKTVSGKGWLSYATYEGLPPRFKKAAKTLQESGELVIEWGP